MRVLKLRMFLGLLLTLIGLQLMDGNASAAGCDEVYPGARVGPPPEWKFWGDGSACFVRWAAQSPEHEERLLARCRETSGVRFIHFERDKGVGHSICIFKLLDPVVAAGAGANPEDKLPPLAAETPPEDKEKAAEDPLQELQILVTRWNEDCLAEERANQPVAAGRCWKDAAGAIERFSSQHDFPVKELDAKLDQLRMTWLERAGQLEGISVDVSDAPPDIEPAATQVDAPDPDRLSATAICSSTKLGDYKSCIGQPVSDGGHLYSFGLKNDCAARSLAAIRTTDAQGRCVRRVVSVSADASAKVESHDEPAVLDAVEFREGIAECYSRRHENISCDGKTDYSTPHVQTKPAVTAKPPQKQASKKKARRKVTVAAEQPARKKARKAASQPKKVAALKVTERKASPRKQKKKPRPARAEPKQEPARTNSSLKCLLFPKSCPAG